MNDLYFVVTTNDYPQNISTLKYPFNYVYPVFNFNNRNQYSTILQNLFSHFTLYCFSISLALLHGICNRRKDCLSVGRLHDGKIGILSLCYSYMGLTKLWYATLMYWHYSRCMLKTLGKTYMELWVGFKMVDTRMTWPWQPLLVIIHRVF